jgi:hypothetical protein
VRTLSRLRLVGVDWVRRRRRVLIGLVIWALVIGSVATARAHWGVTRSQNFAGAFDEAARVHFVNRGSQAVLFDAYDAEDRRTSMLLFSRERSHLDLRADIGSAVRVMVRPLSLDAPGVERRQITWTPVAGTDLEVTVTESGDEERTLTPSAPGSHRSHSMIRVSSRYDLPLKVEYDLAPGNGGIYMPDAEQRYRAMWVGRGVWSFIGGTGATPDVPATLDYLVPALAGSVVDFSLRVPHDGVLEVAVTSGGGIVGGPPTVASRLARWTGF